MAHRRCHGPLLRPAKPDSRQDRGMATPKRPRPFSETLGLISGRKQPVVPPILVLLPARRPAAVGRGIPTFVVHPLQGVEFRRTSPHVGEEVRKEPPAFTHRDPAPAVIRVVPSPRVCASLDHRVPDPVLARAFSNGSRRHPVRGQAFPLKTAAALGRTVQQLLFANDTHLSAFAAAQPSTGGCWTLRTRYSPSAEGGAQFYKMVCAHAGVPYTLVMGSVRRPFVEVAGCAYCTDRAP